MADISLIQGEAKTLRFTITDSSADVVNVDGATSYFFLKKRKSDTTALVGKYSTASDFSTANASVGILTLVLDSTDTNQTEGKYFGEITVALSATNIDKSIYSVEITKKVAT